MVMVRTAMTYLVIAYMIIACKVVADIVMVSIGTASTVMTTAFTDAEQMGREHVYSFGLFSNCPYSYGLYSNGPYSYDVATAFKNAERMGCKNAGHTAVQACARLAGPGRIITNMLP